MVTRLREAGEALEPLEVAVGEDPRRSVVGHRGEAGAGRRRLTPAVLAGQQTARQREVGQQPQAVAHARGNDVVERRAVQHVEVVLRADEARPTVRGRHRLGCVDLLAREVGVADLAHLAGAHERVERRERLVDRYGGIGHVLLVQVDVVGAQTAQAAVDGLAHPARARSRVQGIVVDRRRELGGHHHLVAAAAECPAEQLLGARAAVDVGGVEEVDPRVEGGVHDGGGPLLVATHPEVVAPEPDHADLERPELAHLHRRLPRRRACRAISSLRAAR